MNKIQSGFRIVQIVAVVALVAMASLVAVPKYKAYHEKAKLTEAFTLAGDARKRVNEFYALSGHFPKTAIEADALLPETLTPPEYAEKVVINRNHEIHAISWRVWDGLGNALKAASDKPGAIDAYRKALAIKSDNWNADHQRAMLAELQKGSGAE